MKNNNAHIDLIISACEKTSHYIKGFSKNGFLSDEKTQSAVILQLQVIGEMARKLDKKTTATIEAPWSMIVSLRNVIAHEYFMLKLETIWDIATTKVPALENGLRTYLKAHGTDYMPPFADTTPLMG